MSGSAYQSRIDAAREGIDVSPAAHEARAPETGLDRTHGSAAFATYWKTAQEEIQAGHFRQALATLTPFYGSIDLTPAEHEKLLGVLDPLAGKVIYSTEHLMEEPYVVARGDTLRDIAARYDVPWELLKNINGIDEPSALPPGAELKVVRGPFRAEIELGKNQLTLFVANLYAGRFDIEVHRGDAPMIGKFNVQARTEWPDFEERGARTPANHPDNPYGQWLIDLGGGVKLHSSSPSPAAASLGCISLSPQDAGDVFGILSLGSKVEIRR
jgi:LysM repeat protein